MRYATRFRRTTRGISFGLLFSTLAFAAACGARAGAGQSSPAATPKNAAEKLTLDGVPNLGRASATLYRGGQPTEAGLAALKKIGVLTVVNFRNEKDEIARERFEVETLGLRYVSIPWSGLDTPTNAQLAEFFRLVRDAPDGKIFVHCHYGSDRTGVMVAAYRIAFDHWTPQQAIREMKAYHYHHFWLPHLEGYVKELPERLAADPQLRALELAPVPASP